MTKVFLVVGMHRSATSLVAKGLAQAGVHMGDDLLGAMPSNPHGHWEDVEALRINIEILKASGGGWKNPPDRIHVPDGLDTKVADFVVRRAGRELWGMKDPRLSLTWPAWLPHLEDVDVHVVAVWRSPGQVAASLQRRNGMSEEEGVALAYTYQRHVRQLLDAVDAKELQYGYA